MKKNQSLVKISCLLLCISVAFTGCSPYSSDQNNELNNVEIQNDDIVILYTNDVHCNVEGNVGYDKIAAYKKACMEKTPYVTLVDVGDAVEGELLEKITAKEALVDAMNLLMKQVGYDLRVLGNHEFDLGMDNVKKLIAGSSAPYLACNIQYTGRNENKLADVKPYEIIEYGNQKVAFIGVCTPRTVTKKERPQMQEDGQLVYDFKENVDELYQCVQENVDECRRQGADYVVVLSHLGDRYKVWPHTSINLIKNTRGIDVVLDAHSHSTISAKNVSNLDGEKILMSSTGNELENLGQMVIREDGTIQVGLLASLEERDEIVGNLIEGMK